MSTIDPVREAIDTDPTPSYASIHGEGAPGPSWESPLRVCAFDREYSAKTCGPYLYAVRAGTMAHTAFCTRAALDIWITARGLTPKGDIPAEYSGDGIVLGGAYVSRAWMDVNGFWNLMDWRIAPPIPVLSNGQYTLGIITRDDDGRHVINTINVNRPRPILDRKIAQAVLAEHPAQPWQGIKPWEGVTVLRLTMCAICGERPWRGQAEHPDAERPEHPLCPACDADVARALEAIKADPERGSYSDGANMACARSKMRQAKRREKRERGNG